MVHFGGMIEYLKGKEMDENYTAGGSGGSDNKMASELKNFETIIDSGGRVEPSAPTQNPKVGGGYNKEDIINVTGGAAELSPDSFTKIQKTYKVDGGGLRYDTGKNRLDLIPPEWTWVLGMILTKGAEKYAVRNWERGMDWSKVIAPMKRHMEKFLAGESYDEVDPSGAPGTMCHHMGMVAWNALALMSYDLRKIGNDDRAGDISLLNKVTGSNQKQEKESIHNEPTTSGEDRNKI